MTRLTHTQQKVFDLVCNRLQNFESAPTLQEIANHFGWKSKRAAECHLKAIIQKGWLTSESGKARSLRMASAIKKPRAIVPIFGSIPAGSASERIQESNQCIAVDLQVLGFKPTRNTIALRVAGDSMIGKFIIDGDIVVLEHGVNPYPGQVVAALIDGKSTLKTYLVNEGKPYLQAENPKYPDQIPAEELIIQGVFKALIRQSKS